MIIARAPLRVSLAGGGTDLPAYAERFGGLVVSTSIDRYVYAIVGDAPDGALQITSSDSSTVLSQRRHLFDASLFWGDDHRLAIEVLRHFEIADGCRIFIAAEVPPGTGLGSSSATAVALITALAARRGEAMAAADVAELACHIEIERMGMPIGRQDQYASAFGGLNVIAFGGEGTSVSPCATSEVVRRELGQRLLLFFTGRKRRSTDILSAQREATARPSSPALDALHEIKSLAYDMIAAIEAGDLPTVGRLLDASWEHKRRLASGISTPEIDGWYAEAKAAGAAGGKIAGAGGGGFLLLYVEPEHQRAVIERMAALGLVWLDAEPEREGAMVVAGAPSLALAC